MEQAASQPEVQGRAPSETDRAGFRRSGRVRAQRLCRHFPGQNHPSTLATLRAQPGLGKPAWAAR